MSETENRTCVKCTSVLDRSTVAGVEVDLCPSCGGLWLDKGELERIGRGTPADLARLRGALAGSPSPEPASDTTSACPACPGKLKEVKVASVSVDYCERCGGLFLDKGELDLAVQATGGWTFQQVLSAAAGAVTART